MAYSFKGNLFQPLIHHDTLKENNHPKHSTLSVFDEWCLWCTFSPRKFQNSGKI